MKKISTFLIMLFVLFFNQPSYAQLSDPEQCPGAHCSEKSVKINKICKLQGKQGEPVWVEHNNEFCYCTCSCVAAFTPVQINNTDSKAISDIKVGESVLAYDFNGVWKSQTVDFSEGSSEPEEPMPYVIMVTLSDDSSLIATPDHLFIDENDKLIRADRLTPLDSLKNYKGGASKIISVVHGSYQGAIHNIAINWGDKDISKHIINTNGVLSADYFIQSRQDEYQLDISKKRPQVGTEEYKAKFAKMMTDAVTSTIFLGNDSFFTPYQPIEYPEDVIHLIPDGYYESDANLVHPLDNTVPHAVAKSLINYYKVHYPNINYVIDWGNNGLNAVAYRKGSQRYVSLYGGLLRHKHIQGEGTGLVIAHEIGHHYGGEPRYSNIRWASCEGQSDYWGAAVAQRKVWYGAYYFDQTSKGSEQLYKLFSQAPFVKFLSSLGMKAEDTCDHPPASCRKSTYEAAMKLDDKPACAGDPSEFSLLYMK